jgi:hypothetical protein
MPAFLNAAKPVEFDGFRGPLLEGNYGAFATIRSQAGLNSYTDLKPVQFDEFRTQAGDGKEHSGHA